MLRFLVCIFFFSIISVFCHGQANQPLNQKEDTINYVKEVVRNSSNSKEFEQPIEYNHDFFGNGKLREHLILLKGMADISWRLKAYYMFQYLRAGDFYYPAPDNAFLSRINFELYF